MIRAPGQQFGDYRLVRLLGEGGFAEVYVASGDQTPARGCWTGAGPVPTIWVVLVLALDVAYAAVAAMTSNETLCTF